MEHRYSMPSVHSSAPPESPRPASEWRSRSCPLPPDGEHQGRRRGRDRSLLMLHPTGRLRRCPGSPPGQSGDCARALAGQGREYIEAVYIEHQCISKQDGTDVAANQPGKRECRAKTGAALPSDDRVQARYRSRWGSAATSTRPASLVEGLGASLLQPGHHPGSVDGRPCRGVHRAADGSARILGGGNVEFENNQLPGNGKKHSAARGSQRGFCSRPTMSTIRMKTADVYVSLASWKEPRRPASRSP